jgi:hypothetical protein
MNGKDDATGDVEQVRYWWGMWPDANIGIRPALGLVVLDIDPRNGGDAELAAIQKRHESFPPTLWVRTGSGGDHLWFTFDGPTRGKIGEGIDIKTHSGYVVAPPSLHGSGRRYELARGGPIAPAPGFLRYLLKPPLAAPRPATTGAAPPAVAAGLLRVVQRAHEGNRNKSLFWAVRTAAEKGVDPNPLVDAAVANGLSRREAERTAQSAARIAGGAQ